MDKDTSSLREVQKCTSEDFLYKAAIWCQCVRSTYVTMSSPLIAENNKFDFNHQFGLQAHIQLTADDL